MKSDGVPGNRNRKKLIRQHLPNSNLERASAKVAEPEESLRPKSSREKTPRSTIKDHEEGPAAIFPQHKHRLEVPGICRRDRIKLAVCLRVCSTSAGNILDRLITNANRFAHGSFE